MGSLGGHRIVVAAELLHPWNTCVARGSQTFSVVPGEVALCRTNPHPAVKVVGLAVLVRSAGPITQTEGAGEVEVHFPLPGWFGESHLMRPV